MVAINLFFRNMERISVDIDLCYLKITFRDQVLKEIEGGLVTIASSINNLFYEMLVETKYIKDNQAKKIKIHYL